MSEYKELVAKCEEWIAKADNIGADDLANHISQCADAIEQLVKERDAAVADIQTACGYCKWFRDFGEKVGCFCPKPCTNISGVNTMWEWRGVQEDNDERTE